MSNSFSKLLLSDEERQLLTNSQWILTKRNIMDKVSNLLGYMCEMQQDVIDNEKAWLLPAVVQSAPKISKGENYLQLPYMILDFPRCFEQDNILAIRTMFWWGNFFSITLHVSGKYKAMFEQRILQRLLYTHEEYFICINESEWHHHFEPDNYIPVRQLSMEAVTEIILKKKFVKLAVKMPVTEWNNAPCLADKPFKEMIDMLSANKPSKEVIKWL
jgi:hypothetical protein